MRAENKKSELSNSVIELVSESGNRYEVDLGADLMRAVVEQARSEGVPVMDLVIDLVQADIQRRKKDRGTDRWFLRFRSLHAQ